MATYEEAAAVSTGEAASSDADRPYLLRRLPLQIVFGSFFLLTVPLTFYALGFSSMERGDRALNHSLVMTFYVGGIGISHFFATFLVYLQSANLKHFNSSWKNRALLLILPAALLLFFTGYNGLGIEAFPKFDLFVLSAVRALDFFHFGRQSFGVNQLLKGRATPAFPRWMKRAENAFFLSLAGLLMVTFLESGHRLNPTSPWFLGLAAVSLALLCTIGSGYWRAARSGAARADLLPPLGYFAIQTLAALPGIFWTPLYMTSLVVHFVEYHVLMAPRCFLTPLDPNSKLDRAFGLLRARKVPLYALLLALSFAFFAMPPFIAQSGLRGVGAGLIIHLFDGIFVFHYVVEMFIWKFGDSFYREQLGPLYLGRRSPRTS